MEKYVKYGQNTKSENIYHHKVNNYFLLSIYGYTKLQAILYKNAINMLFSVL